MLICEGPINGVFELVIDRVLAALERVQRRDLDPVAERLAALVQPVARVEVVSDVLVDAQDLHALESGGIACGLGQDGLDLGVLLDERDHRADLSLIHI